MIELLTFRLAAGTDEAEFLAADRRVQEELIPNHPGFLRRTTARGRDGEWLVVVLWASEADADASAAKAESHPAWAAFTTLFDAGSVVRKRYLPLD